ncbi:MAG: SpoIID/LytB domain-containing protein [Elusimicrobiota bacterium]|jgi:stage II sporulation protein D|nr:SpoIID/LytB domain-containing protein [Elusimicrobiota bacterium]
MKKIVLSVLVLFFASYVYCADVSQIIRVGVITDTPSVNVGGSASFSIIDNSGKRYNLSQGMTKLAYSGGQMLLGKNKLALPIRVESAKGLVYAGKTAYRGYILISKTANNKVNVVNILRFEDYLKGVVPKESSAKWPLETLKAQAVISRTYAIANMGKHRAQGFDLCDGTHCQVFGGASAEVPIGNEAVVETAGEVLTYKDRYAQTVFHANCGGHTESPKYVWGWTDIPEYLEGVRCKYCSDAPYSAWETALDESFIRQKLSKTADIGEIQSISPSGQTPGGSAIDVIIKHSKGETIMNAYKFRLTIDAWRIKSNTFKGIKKQNDKFFFVGNGWGHKVGLCQWGARGMGLDGKNYAQILSYYYPKTKIEKVSYK